MEDTDLTLQEFLLQIDLHNVVTDSKSSMRMFTPEFHRPGLVQFHHLERITDD